MFRSKHKNEMDVKYRIIYLGSTYNFPFKVKVKYPNSSKYEDLGSYSSKQSAEEMIERSFNDIKHDNFYVANEVVGEYDEQDIIVMKLKGKE